MPRFSLFFSFLLALTNYRVMAQVLPQEHQNTDSVVVKKKANNGVKNASTVLVKIMPDADCSIYIDGENRGNIKSGNALRLSLKTGEYEIKAVSLKSDSDFIVEDYKVTTAGEEQLCKLTLQPIISGRSNIAMGEHYFNQGHAFQDSGSVGFIRKRCSVGKLLCAM